MNTDRKVRLWSLIVDHADGVPVLVADACAVVISATGVDGVSVTVALDAGPRETVYVSDEVASDLADLTQTLGEGPSLDAADGRPALATDLSSSDCLTRWPMFTPAAASAGVGAVFALPLHVGAIRLGVMDLYRAEPGGLDSEQLADALVLADTACALLLDATLPERSPQDARWPEPIVLAHPEIHEATGMIIVQLGVSAAIALVRLRAYAYAHDRRLRDVAADVVSRRLRFDPDPDPDVVAGGG